jgi:hypothetical protein
MAGVGDTVWGTSLEVCSITYNSCFGDAGAPLLAIVLDSGI